MVLESICWNLIMFRRRKGRSTPKIITFHSSARIWIWLSENWRIWTLIMWLQKWRKEALRLINCSSMTLMATWLRSATVKTFLFFHFPHALSIFLVPALAMQFLHFMVSFFVSKISFLLLPFLTWTNFLVLRWSDWKCREAELRDAVFWRSCSSDDGELGGGYDGYINLRDLWGDFCYDFSESILQICVQCPCVKIRSELLVWEKSRNLVVNFPFCDLIVHMLDWIFPTMFIKLEK